MGKSIRTRGVRSKRSGRVLLPYLILLVGLLFTFVVYYYFSKLTFEQDQSRFQKTVQELQDRIKLKIATSVALLRASTGLFAASDEVDPSEFNRFVGEFELDKNYPGIQGIGFALSFSPEEKDAVIKRMRAHAAPPDFHVWPEGKRDEYTAILYLEPKANRNEVAIGYDMFTDPVRREAMERARDTGLPAASGRVRLVQEPQDQAQQWGFLIYDAVYDNGAPTDTVEQRRRALAGYVYSPFRIDDFLAPVTAAKNYDVSFQIYEGSVAEENYFHGPRDNPTPGDSRFTYLATIPVEGRTWMVSYAIKPSFERGSSRPLLKYTLITGVLLSFLFFAVTRAEVRARSRAEQSSE
jgi:CHASE1-domain containing sensor protein